MVFYSFLAFFLLSLLNWLALSLCGAFDAGLARPHSGFFLVRPYLQWRWCARLHRLCILQLASSSAVRLGQRYRDRGGAFQRRDMPGMVIVLVPILLLAFAL